MIFKNRLVIYTFLILGFTFVCFAMTVAFGGQNRPINDGPAFRIQATGTAGAVSLPPIRDITAQPPVTDVVIYPTFGTSIVQSATPAPTQTTAPTATLPPAPTKTPTPIVIIVYPTFGTSIPPTQINP